MAFRRLIPIAVACSLTTAMATPAQASRTAPEPYCVVHKCIALTFDDGPAENTETLLKVLKKYKAKATFFMIGNRVKKNLKLVGKVAKDGHEIGNHTWDHKYFTDLTSQQIYVEVRDAQRIIKKATGKNPVLFRAPGGLYTEDAKEIVAKFGMVQIPGTVATKDYIKDYRNVKLLTSKALEIAEPGAVVLMHETVKETISSLPTVLRELTKQGYRFVTVSKLLEGQKLTPGEVYPDMLPDDSDEMEFPDGTEG
ncbi:polysaccharide deacetylase family protein [Sphaerimonospora sp. CA-214678]|uniref:polysaccharide deacetylase family protein n=1 Tax=Sphaerimonospora sp. CA-214678 TaxID=3240029 RepID=UPI003D91AEC3